MINIANKRQFNLLPSVMSRLLIPLTLLTLICENSTLSLIADKKYESKDIGQYLKKFREQKRSLENFPCNEDILEINSIDYDETPYELPQIKHENQDSIVLSAYHAETADTDNGLMKLSPSKTFNYDITKETKLFDTNSNELYAFKDQMIFKLVNFESMVKFNEVTTIRDVHYEKVQDIQLVNWSDLQIIVIKEMQNLNVYVHTPSNTMNVQHLVFPAETIQKSLIFVLQDVVYVIVATTSVEKKTGKISLYKWHESHFVKESNFDTNLIESIYVFQNNDECLLMTTSYDKTSKSQTKSDIYQISSSGMHLIQHIFFGSDFIREFSLKDKHYILACSSKDECYVYMFTNGKFTKTHQIHRKFNDNISVFSNNEMVAILEYNQISFHLNPNLSKIAVLNISTENLKKVLLTTDNNLILIYIHEGNINIHMNEIELGDQDEVGESQSTVSEDVPLKEILNSLRLLIEDRINYIREISYTSLQVLHVNRNIEINKPLKISGPVIIKAGSVKNLTIFSEDLESTNDKLLHDIIWMNRRINQLLNKIDPPKRTSRSSRQTNNPSKMIIKNLHYNGDEFKNLLRKSTDNTISKPSLISKIVLEKNLKVNDNKINKIIIHDAALRYPNRTQRINGLKTFDYIITENIGMPSFNEASKQGHSFRTKGDLSSSISGTVSVMNLKIRSVNNIPWNQLEEGLKFKQSRIIHGNLYVNRPSLIQNISTHLLQDQETNKFFTKTSNQNVYSTIGINGLYTPSISTELLNGMNFKDVVALAGQQNIINTHTIISKMNVTGSLKLSEDNVGGSHHVIGTRKEDLQQIYTGNVIIKGSLKIKDLKNNNEASEILIENTPFLTAFKDKYWLNTENQDISIFKFANLVTVPQLQATNINQHSAFDYLLLDSNPSSKLRLVFKHSYISGNVLSESKYPTKVTEIDQLCIRRKQKSTIDGKIYFKDDLSVKSLLASDIKEQLIDDIVLNMVSLNQLIGLKHINHLDVQGPLYLQQNINVQNLNDTNLEYLFSNAISMDQNTELNQLTFNELRITNLNVVKMQGIQFDHFLKNMYAVLNTTASVRNIEVSESAFFEHDLQIKAINGIILDDYFEQIINKHHAVTVYGQVKFAKLLINQHLWLGSTINKYDLHEWENHGLVSTRDQMILGNWKINDLSLDDLAVSQINGVPMYNVMNAKSSSLKLYSNINGQRIDVLQNCETNLDNTMKNLDHVLQHPVCHNYDKLTVEGALLYPLNYISKFSDILLKAVTVDDHQEIHTYVEFVNGPYMKNIKSTTELINNINIFSIHADSLKLSSTKKQIVYAPKRFLNFLDTKFSIVKYKIDTLKVNGIDIIGLNQTIYRKNNLSNYVDDKLIFRHTPIIGELNVAGKINTVEVENVAFEKTENSITALSMDNLQIVNNLMLANINNMSLDYLLENRIRLYGSPQEIYGHLTFQNLIVLGYNHLPIINGIDTRSIVKLKWHETQLLDGRKSITGSVFLNGPIHCLKIDTYDMSDLVKSNVQKGFDYRLKKINVRQLNVAEGISVEDGINGYSIDPFLYSETPKNTNDETSLIVPNTKNMIQNTIEMVQSHQLSRCLYLEYVYDLEVLPINEYPDQMKENAGFIMDLDMDCHAQMEIRISNNGKIYIKRHVDLYRSYIKDSDIMLQMEIPIRNCQIEKSIAMNWSNGNQIYNVSGIILSPPAYVNVENKPFIGILSKTNEQQTAFELIYLNKANQWSLKQVIDLNEGLSAKILKVDENLVTIITTKQTAEIFLYNSEEEKFEHLDKLSGMFNLISDVITMETERMLALGFKNSKSILIYKLITTPSKELQVHYFQTLSFNERIKKIQVLNLEGTSYLAVIMADGHFHVYRYNFVDGWISVNYSYFADIESIASFKFLNQKYLLIVSSNTASVVRMYCQS